VGPDVAKKNLVEYGGLELVESLPVIVGLMAAEMEALRESSECIFHFLNSLVPLFGIVPLPKVFFA